MDKVDPKVVVPKHTKVCSLQTLEQYVNQEALRVFVLIDGTTNLEHLMHLTSVDIDTLYEHITTLLKINAIELFQRVRSSQKGQRYTLAPYKWPLLDTQIPTHTHIYPFQPPVPQQKESWAPDHSLAADDLFLQEDEQGPPTQQDLPATIPPEAHHSPLPTQRERAAAESSDRLPAYRRPPRHTPSAIPIAKKPANTKETPSGEHPATSSTQLPSARLQAHLKDAQKRSESYEAHPQVHTNHSSIELDEYSSFQSSGEWREVRPTPSYISTLSWPDRPRKKKKDEE
ncbi:MAG TPA: hypothetical protein DCE42_16445 [Myxococcales bacterium]|nr:hypothetical protein [Deltaproteobacteria bacterium]MBU48134.1 hypothetical protein [Deltaproteobacteria bacterium]HAA56356.1 hypothetical protein [Myxococcales bacterium]|tara:strand:- start:13151 stop:14008 length:858 start_codon:yes stop_codon:yes gene_type:complete